MIYISVEDEYKEALELGNKLVKVKRKRRQTTLQLLDLQLTRNKNQQKILKLKRELNELGVDYEERKQNQ